MKAPKLEPNLPDDMHCVQCCAKMVIDYFCPERQVTMPELEAATAFGPKGTWEMHELLNYKSFGIEAKEVSIFDYEAFAEDAASYLREFFGPQLAAQFLEQTVDIDLEMKRAKKVVAAHLAERRIPTKTDITRYVHAGWLVMLLVNARKLHSTERQGYMGHRVLVYDAKEEGVYMNDPGSPALAEIFVSWPKLEKAWADPNPEAKAMIVARKL